ncbi:MAG: sigma-70 family RNA polymerase sigma factor [Synergistales bacterium]|nr:sigma-70 family RNA polymerase sigma factor [Synergistales bacterium]
MLPRKSGPLGNILVAKSLILEEDTIMKLTAQQKETLTKKHIGQIRKIAWNFHNTTGVDVEELISEGCLAFVKDLEKYDPEKAALSTYTHWVVTSHLKNYLRKCSQNRATAYDDEIMELIPFEGTNAEQYLENEDTLADILRALSPKGFEVVDMVLSNPEDFLGITSRGARGKIQGKLRAMGWKWNDIWDSIREVKQVVNTF